MTNFAGSESTHELTRELTHELKMRAIKLMTHDDAEATAVSKISHQGEVFKKGRAGKYKSHYFVVKGGEIQFWRDKLEW